MNKKNLVLVLFVLSILILSMVNSSILADHSETKDTSKPITFSTYPSFYTSLDSSDEINIIYPRSTIPVILSPEDTFIIEFKSIVFDHFSASISTSYDQLVDTILLPIDSITSNDNIFYATVNVPSDVPNELYNLTLTIESAGQSYTTSRPRAVCVKNANQESFNFVHLADFHIGDPRGLTENAREIFGWKAARKTIQEINLIKPDFVIISGDLTFGQLYPFEYSYEYPTCYRILQDFEVPTYLSPGNHDGYIQTFQDGFSFWEEYFGPLYYSIDYDDIHIVNVNSYDWPAISRIGFSYLVFNWGGSIQDEQLNWIEQDLEENSDANQIFINLHHNPLWDTKKDSLVGNGYYNQQPFLDIIRANQVDAVFSGHVHRDNITQDNGTLYVTTTTASSSHGEDEYWGYRLIQFENDTIIDYNYQDPDKSIPSYQINVLDVQSHSITIENKLLEPISIQYEFIVENEDYTVNNGEIIQKREKEDMVAIYVSATIDAETTETIMLS